MKRARADRELPYLRRRRRIAWLSLLVFPIIASGGLFGLIGAVFFHQPGFTLGLVNGRYCLYVGGEPQERYECQLHGIDWPGVVERWGVPRRFFTSFGYGHNIPPDEAEFRKRYGRLDWTEIGGDLPRVTGNLQTWGIVVPSAWAVLLSGGLFAYLHAMRVVIRQRLDAGFCPRCRYPSPDLGGDRCPVCRLRLSAFLLPGTRRSGDWSQCPATPIREVRIAKSGYVRRRFALCAMGVLAASGVTYGWRYSATKFLHYQSDRFSFGLMSGAASFYWGGDATDRYASQLEMDDWPAARVAPRSRFGARCSLLRLVAEPMESTRPETGWSTQRDEQFMGLGLFRGPLPPESSSFGEPVINHEAAGGRFVLPTGWLPIVAWLVAFLWFRRWRQVRRMSRHCLCARCGVNLVGSMPSECLDCGSRIRYRRAWSWRRIVPVRRFRLNLSRTRKTPFPAPEPG